MRSPIFGEIDVGFYSEGAPRFISDSGFGGNSDEGG